MSTRNKLHSDRLFPVDEAQRDIARQLYEHIKDFPIISPYGHTDPRWFAGNENFGNPAELLIQPDHYVLRMLCSQGVSMEAMGLKPKDGGDYEINPRNVWQPFVDDTP